MPRDDRSLLRDLVLSRGDLDRAAHLRADVAWQARHRWSAASRVIWVGDGGVALAGTADDLWLTPANEVDAGLELTFLGVDGAGTAFYAAHVADRDAAPLPAVVRWGGLRDVGATLSGRDAGMAVTAIAIDNWMHTHLRCPVCGEPTVSHAAGWSRRCPLDGTDHFPRTDPAVIMLVIDRQDRALLGRQARWSPGWFSTLAGFVESGESAEAAVRREVSEEAGVVIGDGPDDIRYLGSQPWPFPCSLMLGYHAWTDDPTVEVDGVEIAEARWFSRDQLDAACASGDVRLPPSVSIARKLVERWYGSELPGSWSRN